MERPPSGLQPTITRRQFFSRSSSALGIAALAHLLGEDLVAQDAAATPGSTMANGALPGLPHIPPKARRVIYLFQSGGPSHLDLFDYKPLLAKVAGTDLPPSVRRSQRQSAMSAGQPTFPVVPSKYAFARHGESGAWLSELLPYTAKVADDICFIKSVQTNQVNHDPAITLAQTGFQLAGRPCLGSWVAYGLGTANSDLPAFVVMVSGSGEPLYDRLWGSGFIPSRYQAVKLRSAGDRVLYLSDPDGFDRDARRRFIDDLAVLNQERFGNSHDPEISTRIAQYEMAFRMQATVPELIDLSQEPPGTFELYGEDAKQPGTFASNCLLARRLAERGVRFIQLYHRGWDHHYNLTKRIGAQAASIDQASAGLIQDLKQRGLLDDTLIVWGGEFGRTVYQQGNLAGPGDDDYGRDHHGGCFTVWMAGGGVKPGLTHGTTDDYGHNVVSNPVEPHDLNATILHQLGIDHTRLTYKFQGRNFRLTDVGGKVLTDILA